MVDKLIVKDFGPIRDAEMDIKKTTVLIGPQGSGKSTLAKLVAILRQKRYEKIERKDLKFYNLPDSYLKKSTFLNLLSDYSIPNTEYDHKREYDKFLKGNQPSSYLLPVYIPAERVFFPMVAEAILGLLTQKVAIPDFVLEFGREYELARKSIIRLPVHYLNIEYKYEGGRDYVFFNESESVLLSESASGFQSVIPIKLVIKNNDNLFSTRHFIVEEPELNLYPTTQKKLIYDLADCCTELDNQLIMTTHSPYVLAALNNLLFANKIAQEKPEKAVEVEKVIPRFSWLNPDDFAAYFVADGTVRSIIDSKTGLISENELDSVSDEIGDEFDTLMDIYRSKKHD